MRIVVLDGFTLNPGDLSWKELEALGDLTVYDRSTPSEIEQRVQGAEIVMTNKAPLTRALIQSLPDLKAICVHATGTNNIDLQAARDRGIPVMNVPGYSTASVAQFTFALILELCHHVGHHSHEVRKGRWTQCKDFTFSDFPALELDGKTLGIVGYGAIGKAVGQIGQAMGMNLLIHSRTPQEGFVDRDTVFSQADVLTLHCPLTPENKGLVNTKTLALMKPSALLINTARGPLIVEQDLADALNSNRVAGAGLDVLCIEPPESENPLLNAKNCVITPHIAWATKAARSRLMTISVENLRSFFEGNPSNVVNP